MVLSDYVIESIRSIEHFDAHNHFSAAVVIKDAALKSTDERDLCILNTVGAVLAMGFSSEKQEFTLPSLFAEGQAFSLARLGQEDCEALEVVAENFEVSWIRAQIYHVLWDATKNRGAGEKAVESYMRCFGETFDPDNWVDCNAAIQRAYQIAAQLGRKTALFRQMIRTINGRLLEMNGNDPLFLSLSLLQLTIQDVPKEILSQYLQIVTNLADKNISGTNQNTYLADETFAVQEMLLKKLGMGSALETARLKYAGYYEVIAEQEERQQNYPRAVMHLKKACELFVKFDRTRVLVLRARLADYQQKALKSMHCISYEIDTEPVHKLAVELFSGLTIQEGVVQLGRMALIHRVEDVKQALHETQTDAPISTFFGSELLNEKGQTVGHLPPLREIDKVGTDLLYKHMVHHVAESRRYHEGMVLGIAFAYFRELGELKESDLDFLVENNAIVPEGREQIIKEGLALGLKGQFYASLHILLPQTEHIIRQLVEICGDTVTYLKDDGTEEYKPLSQLFKSQKLVECYSGDILFTLYSIMDDPCGENLRNLTGHGLLDPRDGNGWKGICFICLLVRLLLMYSEEGLRIASRLVERNPS